MFTVRLILVLIGLAVLAGIYLWGTSKSRQRRRASLRTGLRQLDDAYARRAASERDRDAREGAPPDGEGADIEFGDIGDEGPVLFRDAASQKGTMEAAARSDRQMELGLDAHDGPAPASPEKPARQRIIVLYLEAQGDRVLAGRKVDSALKSVGMQFGDMGIYHHYGLGQMRAQQPLFSVANMFEPGAIDIEALEKFQTKGLAMFLRLPAAIDGLVAFELMLNTAQRLAELLPAELRDDDHQALDSRAIEELRETVAAFEHEYA